MADIITLSYKLKASKQYFSTQIIEYLAEGCLTSRTALVDDPYTGCCENGVP
jgi:hypothetical protein